MQRKNNKAILVCTICLNRNYTTSINRDKQTKRLQLLKYCPHCNKHTLHQETK